MIPAVWLVASALAISHRVSVSSVGKISQDENEQPVRALAVSTDGSTVYTGGVEGHIDRFKMKNGEAVAKTATLKHGSWVYSLALSPDNKKLASAGEDGKVRVWDTESNNLIHNLAHSDKPTGIHSVIWSPDSYTLFSGGADGKISVWDANDGHKVQSFEMQGKPSSMVETESADPWSAVKAEANPVAVGGLTLGPDGTLFASDFGGSIQGFAFGGKRKLHTGFIEEKPESFMEVASRSMRTHEEPAQEKVSDTSGGADQSNQETTAQEPAQTTDDDAAKKTSDTSGGADQSNEVDSEPAQTVMNGTDGTTAQEPAQEPAQTTDDDAAKLKMPEDDEAGEPVDKIYGDHLDKASKGLFHLGKVIQVQNIEDMATTTPKPIKPTAPPKIDFQARDAAGNPIAKGDLNAQNPGDPDEPSKLALITPFPTTAPTTTQVIVDEPEPVVAEHTTPEPLYDWPWPSGFLKNIPAIHSTPTTDITSLIQLGEEPEEEDTTTTATTTKKTYVTGDDESQSGKEGLFTNNPKLGYNVSNADAMQADLDKHDGFMCWNAKKPACQEKQGKGECLDEAGCTWTDQPKADVHINAQGRANKESQAVVDGELTVEDPGEVSNVTELEKRPLWSDVDCSKKHCVEDDGSGMTDAQIEELVSSVEGHGLYNGCKCTCAASNADIKVTKENINGNMKCVGEDPKSSLISTTTATDGRGPDALGKSEADKSEADGGDGDGGGSDFLTGENGPPTIDPPNIDGSNNNGSLLETDSGVRGGSTETLLQFGRAFSQVPQKVFEMKTGSAVNAIAVRGHELYAAQDDGRLSVWDVSRTAKGNIFKHNAQGAQRLSSLVVAGNQMFAAGSDGVHRVSSGKLSKCTSGSACKTSVVTVAASAHGGDVYAALANGEVVAIDASTMKEQAKWRGA